MVVIVRFSRASQRYPQHPEPDNQLPGTHVVTYTTTRDAIRGVAASPRGPSFPPRHAPRLLDPLVHLRSLRLLQGLHLDVAGSFGGSKRRRRVESRAAEEDDVHGDVVGDHLDDPPEFWQPVVRLLPLDGVLKPGDRLADQFVQPLDDGMQIRHHAPDPILEVGVTIRWHGRFSGRIWLAWFRHRTFSSVAERSGASAAPWRAEGAAGVRCTRELYRSTWRSLRQSSNSAVRRRRRIVRRSATVPRWASLSGLVIPRMVWTTPSAISSDMTAPMRPSSSMNMRPGCPLSSVVTTDPPSRAACASVPTISLATRSRP